MLSFFKLIRYQNLLMVILTMCLIRYALLPHFTESFFLPTTWFVYLLLGVVCITAGGYVINDIYDIKADKINKPGKTYVGSSVSTAKAFYYYLFLTLFGVGFGTYLSIKVDRIELSLFFIATTILLFLYTRFLKRTILLGNALISVLVSLPIFMVYIYETIKVPEYNSFFEMLAGIFSAVGMYLIVLYYMLFSFLATLIRELIKDIEDVNGDHHMKMKTLPIVFGMKRARNIAIVFSIIFVMSLILISKAFIDDSHLFILGIYNYVFLVLPLLYFIYVLWTAKMRKQFSFLSNYMKWIMVLGILSILIFKF